MNPVEFIPKLGHFKSIFPYIKEITKDIPN